MKKIQNILNKFFTITAVLVVLFSSSSDLIIAYAQGYNDSYVSSPSYGYNDSYVSSPNYGYNDSYVSTPNYGYNDSYVSSPSYGYNDSYVSSPNYGYNDSYVSTPNYGYNDSYVSSPSYGYNDSYVSSPNYGYNDSYVSTPNYGYNDSYVSSPSYGYNDSYVSSPNYGYNDSYVSTPNYGYNDSYVSSPSYGYNDSYVSSPNYGYNDSYVSTPNYGYNDSYVGNSASPVTATPVYATPVYNTPVYNTPVYSTPVYNTPVYNTPVTATPVYSPAVVYNQTPSTNIYGISTPNVVYNQNPTYTPAPTYNPTPTVTTYLCWNGQRYSSPTQCPAQPEQTKYCDLTQQSYTLSTYSSQCRRWCTFTNAYYYSLADYNNLCKQTPIQCPVNYTNQNNVCVKNKVFCQYTNNLIDFDATCSNPCNSSQYWNGSQCVNRCTNNQTWNGAQCVTNFSRFCDLTNQTYTSQADYDAQCKRWCNYTNTYYYTLANYNTSCVQQTRLCPLTGQTYPISSYDQSCRKFCQYNNFYYSTQAEYDAGCRAPNPQLYCALNGQTYTSQSDYANGCRKYCSENGYWYTTQNEYNTYCKPITKTCPNGSVVTAGDTCPSYYCALNGQTYYSQNDLNNSCKKYCSYNDKWYLTQVDYDNYCKAVVVNNPTYYCNINGQTYNNVNDYNTYCKRVTPNKTCPNGQVVPETEACPMAISHRVVTTVPTQVTTNSAKCNGVAMIGGGVMSIGYFEYGTTPNLGATTNSASIGNQTSTAFSNLVTGLQPNTTYYCRAVMSNANGVYRGELMSFKTSATVVNYIPTPKPIVTTVKTVVKGKTVTKSVVTTPKTQLVCQDINGVSSTVNAGEKLINLTIAKANGNLVKGGNVDYKVSYTNTSKLTLSNVTVKVTLPEFLEYIGNTGSYDRTTNTVTMNIGSVSASDSRDITIHVKVNNNVEVGRTIVTTAYASYEILDNKGNVMKDEVTAYTIGTVVADQNTNNNTNNINVNSKTDTDTSMWPNTLLEWIAILALILILIVLGRAIYVNVVGDDKHNRSH